MAAGGLSIILALVAVVLAVGNDTPLPDVIARGSGIPMGVIVIALGHQLGRVPESRD